MSPFQKEPISSLCDFLTAVFWLLPFSVSLLRRNLASPAQQSFKDCLTYIVDELLYLGILVKGTAAQRARRIGLLQLTLKLVEHGTGTLQHTLIPVVFKQWKQEKLRF